jgi:hypothetical protein
MASQDSKIDDEKNAKLIERINTVKRILTNLSDVAFTGFKEQLEFLMDIDINLMKKVFDHDYYGTLLGKFRDNDSVMILIEIGQNLAVDLMDNSKDHSVLQRVLKYPYRDGRKTMVEKILEICIAKNRVKFFEIVKKTDIGDLQKVMIIDMMWKSQGKSLSKNFDEIINYINSGVQVSGNSFSSTITFPPVSVPGNSNITFPVGVPVNSNVAFSGQQHPPHWWYTQTANTGSCSACQCGK